MPSPRAGMRGSISIEWSIPRRVQEHLAHQPRLRRRVDSRRGRRDVAVEQRDERREQLVTRHVAAHLAGLLRSFEKRTQREPASPGYELGAGCIPIRAARLLETAPCDLPHRAFECGAGVARGSCEAHSPAGVRAAPAGVASGARASEAAGTIRTGRWVCWSTWFETLPRKAEIPVSPAIASR